MAQTLPDRPVLTVREAAAVLGVNVKTLYNEIHEQRFPAIHLGRVIRIARSVVSSFLEQGRVPLSGETRAGRTRS